MKIIKVILALLIAICLLIPASIVYADDTWGLGGWAYRKQLTFDNTASAENLENFPVLVHLDDTNIDWTKVQNSGEDIRFTDSNGIDLLDYEIELWDDTNDAWIWVEVPQIDLGVDTDYIYMYYGNEDAVDGQNVAGTWNANYVAVYHMDDDPDTSHIVDSTGIDGDGTKVGANEPIETNGLIAKGQGFDDTNDKIDIQDEVFATESFTIEAWVMKVNWIEDYSINTVTILGKDGDHVASQGLRFQIVYRSNGAVGYLRLYTKIADGVAINHSFMSDYGNLASNKTDFADGVYCSITRDYFTKTAQFYWNGIDAGNDVNAGTEGDANGVDNAVLGYHPNQTEYLDAIMDEVRISNIARSADWIEATDLNFDETFITFGSEENVPANPPTNLSLTAVNDNQVDITWAIGAGASLTEIRRAIGDYPTDRTEGTQVYSGALEEYSDTANDVGLELDKYVYYYRAWCQNALGTWSAEYDEGEIGGANMAILAIFGFAGILSFLSFRSTFPLLKFAAAIAWIAGFLYIKDNPPSPLVEGSAAHTAILLVLIVIAVAIPLAGLGRDIQRSRDTRTGLTTQSRFADWKFNFGKSKQEFVDRQPTQTRETEDEYREKIRRALRRH